MMSSNKTEELKDKGEAMSVGSNALSIMELNGLKYRIPQPLSTGVMRTYKREFAQKQSYNTQAPVIFDFNTGTSYVEPQSALLSFELVLLQTTGGATYQWGEGLGACSLFSEIRIISKNGVEIDRVQSANVLAKVLADYTMSAEARRNMEMADGFAAGGAGLVTAANTRLVVPITIPLKLISGFFRPTVEGMLIPAGLSSGLRIEMTLAPASRAFQQTGGGAAPLSYTVENPEILMQLTDLNDPVQSALMKESAANGLEYTFPSYFATEVSNQGSSQITEQVKKAVSQATRIFTAIYDKGVDDVDLLAKPGFKQINPDRYGAYQYRVGSSYYPQQTVTRPTEFWAIANSAFDMLRKFQYHPNQVNYQTFTLGGKSLLATSLETNDRLNLSGLPINNSSVAEFRFTQKAGTDSAGGGTANTAAIVAVIFAEFISVTKTSLNRTTLRI